MILMNLLIALVAGLILFESLTRTPMSRSVRFSGHRERTKRAFAQAGVALVAAMIVATSNPEPQQVSPLRVFGSAAILGIAEIYRALRSRRLPGRRLLIPGKMFTAQRWRH